MNINPNLLNQLVNFRGSREIDQIVRQAQPAGEKIIEKLMQEAPKVFQAFIQSLH